MIRLKSEREIGEMRKPGKLIADIHKRIAKMIKPGITTMEIEKLVKKTAAEHGATPSQIGYKGYPYATCAAVNDCIAHGFPSRDPLKNGDIVTIDMVLDIDGWKADSAWSYAVGDVSQEALRLLTVTKQCLYKGIEQAVTGNRLGDIGHAIQKHAEENGYSVVRDLVAHGIGQHIHEDPAYVHVGPPGRGVRIKEGMTFTVEPMINEGMPDMFIEDDGWTARTVDGLLSAQFEHTIAITRNGPEILTEQSE